MSKKLTVLEMPLYRDYFQVFLEILEKLENLMKSNSKHSKLSQQTYETIISAFSNLNAGFNYWGMKGKMQLYNKVRIELSKVQTQLYFLYELKLLNKDYFEELENSIRYLGGLIKKIEGLPNDIK